MEEASKVMSIPMVQYGFAGFSLTLLGVLVWLIRQLLDVLKSTNFVIAANTTAMIGISERADLLLDRQLAMHEKLISRPCIARGEK